MDADDSSADERFNDNCIIYAGGADGCTTMRVPLAPLHGALERFRVPPGHRCYPGYGLRAREPIARGTHLGDYGGVWVPVLSLADTTPYTMGFDEGCVSGVEALHYGNLLRYMNDPRGADDGVSANVRTEHKWIYGAGRTRQRRRFMTAAFYAARDVEAGEELLVDYGEQYDMGLEPSPWRAKAECRSGGSGTTPPMPRKRYKPALTELDECGTLMHQLKGMGHWQPDAATLKRNLEHELLSCIKRKLENWPLTTDSFTPLEIETLSRLRRTHDPGHLIRCSGPCQRELPRSHYGLVEMRSRGWGWPPCNECCAGFMSQPPAKIK